LSNAVKFTEEGGITMRVAYRRSPTPAFLSFEVEDTGAGIAEDELDKVF
jgi:signal transduction histidine kinase